jgi:membrane-bound lytic murein transglycosylase D
MGADGIWQIMPNTGKHYKMLINDFVDERRDIYKSTQVAAQLLNDTYRYFSNKGAEDWLLAYCAYNAGMGNVNKVLQGQGGSKFTDLVFRTQETNEYVWKAIAIKYIFENEEKIFGSKFDREPDMLQTTKVIPITLKGHYKLDEWAKAQGTNIGSVYELNPWIKIYRQSRKKYSDINDVVLPAGIHNILVPIEAVPDSLKVAEIEKQFLNSNAGFFTHHVVKRGDNLYNIARKYKTSVAKIKELNGMTSNMIRPGQKLKLYGNASSSKGSYTVQKGDSISGISSKLKVSQKLLISKNNLKKNKNGLILIYPGQKLKY